MNTMRERIASYPNEVLTVVPLSQTPCSSQQVAIVRPPLSAQSIRPFLGPHDPREQSLCAFLDVQTKLMNQLGNMQDQFDRLAHNAEQSDVKISQILATQKNIVESQDKIMEKMDTILANTEALLTQTFELHEYTLPRLFIVLPEVAYHGLNPALILSRYTSVKFRLYFLCECGTHTSPTGPHRLNHIHIARHEGYEIKRPTEFFCKYGPHVLRLLRVLKFGLTLASGVIPALSTINDMDLPAHITKDLGLRVTSCIQYLSAHQQSLDYNVPDMGTGGDNAITLSRPQSTMTDDVEPKSRPLSDIVQIEGADLRRLDSFLQKKDQDRALGNLFRTVDEHGHVKWICLDHYRSTYHLRQDREFENEILLNHGQYDKRLGIVTVVLPSSEAISAFLTSMTRAGAFNELDIHLRNYSYHDLKILGDSLSKTNVSKLTLTGHQYKEISSMCKKKLPPVLTIMAAGKVRHFQFKDIKDLIPSRGVQIPKSMSAVRSLELTGISLKDGHEVLAKLLHACDNLAVFRLTDTSIKPSHLKSVLDGLTPSENLHVLSLRNCEISTECTEILTTFLRTCPSLTELDLSLNCLDDSSCCDIIGTIGSQLARLSLSNTGFGDESAMALERDIGGELLKRLDISCSSEELSPDAMESVIRLIGRLQCTELMLPRVQDPSDELCAKAIRDLDASRLGYLEIEGSFCGDQTALSLARMLSVPPPELVSFKIDLPRLSLTGAQALGDALPSDCQVAAVSFGGSQLFQSSARESQLLQNLFASVCSRLTTLTLMDTAMNDDVALILCEALQGTNPVCRLEYLDLTDNTMTPAGGAVVLESLHQNKTLQTLRMGSQSFVKFGSMGPAVQQFLETNRTLCCLSVSHVDLCELTIGLSHNANTLKAIEAQYVDGNVDDIFTFGDFIKSKQNTLLRLVIRQARVCDDEKSLEHLSQLLKQNQSIIDLEWDFDQGYDADGHVLQRYLDRNRDLWRKKADAKEKDLILAGIDTWTVRAICRGIE
ncbi:NACHT, LRR and PYD domains-containing protein 14 [Mortierella sp. AM989]|nr:NACHT, LRR and PYD domains-containing protein 14 [Mortierella sp. AM989]